MDDELIGLITDGTNSALATNFDILTQKAKNEEDL